MLTGNIGIHFDHDRGILLWQVECRRIMTGEFAGTAKPAVIEPDSQSVLGLRSIRWQLNNARLIRQVG